MTKKILFSVLSYFFILNTFHCEAQSENSASKLLFSTIGTNTYVTKEEFLNYYNKYKKALLKSPYFDSQKNFAPTNFSASKYNLKKFNYQHEMDNIVNTISYKAAYKNDTLSDVYIKWNYNSKIFKDDNFGYVCKMDVSLNKIFSNNTSYTKKMINQLSKIDSVEVNYNYSYPVKIDSLQIDFSSLSSKKISSNIYIEKYSINGFILDIKNTETDDFIYLKAFDAKNKELYCRLYNDNNIPTTYFIDEFAELYSKLIADLKKQNNVDAVSIEEVKTKLIHLKFHSYLFSIPSKTKKIVLYFSKERFEKIGTKYISN